MENIVKDIFNRYPVHVLPLMLSLRALILETAESLQLEPVEESIKWGEPSYSVKTGSPIRMDWKAATPEHYYLFFHCQSKLVDCFRELYADQLTFQKNRAIVLALAEPLPRGPLQHCIELALTYHRVKHLPLLGAQKRIF